MIDKHLKYILDFQIIYENKITISFDVQGKKQKLEIMS